MSHLPRCSYWTYRTRCTEPATTWLLGPDGEPNPGGYLCREHGESIVRQYREKLGEAWSLAPLTDTEEGCDAG